MGAPKTKRRGRSTGFDSVLEGMSRKSIRLLEQDGILEQLRRGATLVVTGPVARLRTPGPFVRLAFCIDAENRLNIGYAVGEGPGGPWVDAGGEFELFSLRTYGYYTRYLKRLPPIG